MHQNGNKVVHKDYVRRDNPQGNKQHLYVANLEKRKEAGADKIVNEFYEIRGRRNGEGLFTIMGMLRNWTWKRHFAPKRWREGVCNVFFLDTSHYGSRGSIEG